MGTLIYEDLVTAEFEDRVLAHLQFAIGSRLRLGQGFFLTCPPDATGQGGRTVFWINPQSALVFRYDDDAPLTMNRAWIEQLVEAASTTGGMFVTPEPPAPTSSSAAAVRSRRTR